MAAQGANQGTKWAATAPASQSATGAAAASPLVARDDFDRNVWSVLGVPIDVCDASAAVAAIETSARNRTKLSFVTPNVNFLVRALNDPKGRRDILNADLSLIDGAPLVAIARLLGMKGVTRCAGSDVFEALRRRPSFAGRQLRVFFFGGREGAAKAAADAIARENRGLAAAGYLEPGFGDVESMSTDDVISRINETNPDFVIAALGAAKGQAWIDRNNHRLSAPIISHLGAVVDFTAGTISRAPALVSRLGFEWAWRIKEEPTLWRRYWGDARAFARILLTKLLPLLALSKSDAKTNEPAAATFSPAAQGARVDLTGDLVFEGLAPVRTAFRRAAAAGGIVVVNLSDAGALDAAFFGLLLMLEKRLGAEGGIVIEGASPRQRRLFAAHSLAYRFADRDRGAAAAQSGIAAAM